MTTINAQFYDKQILGKVLIEEKNNKEIFLFNLLTRLSYIKATVRPEGH